MKKLLLFATILFLATSCSEDHGHHEGHHDLDNTDAVREATAAQEQNTTVNESILEEDSSMLYTGQLVFASAYSSIGKFDRAQDLSASALSVRNTSTTGSITIRFADFYDDHGVLTRNLEPTEVVIPPMGSRLYSIDQRDEVGGAGSNYLLEWVSDSPVTAPYIESITYRYAGTKALAFATPGMVLRERR